MSLHPVVGRAARGDLPSWARIEADRHAHVERVADLLEAWARARGLDAEEVLRWRGLGMLHDVLRDEDPDRLRSMAPSELRDLSPAMLHAPAAAARLREQGVADLEFLHAITYHPTGHREWGILGRSLYMADFLEPGRSFRAEWRGKLRDRAVEESEEVLREVVRARIEWAIGQGLPVRRETVDFWNSLVSERKGDDALDAADPGRPPRASGAAR